MPFDYEQVDSVSAQDLQREALLQTVHGKLETVEISEMLKNAKVHNDTLQYICAFSNNVLMNYLMQDNIPNHVSTPFIPLPRRVAHPLIDLNISDDRMVARITLKEPARGMPFLTVDNIVDFLHQNQIVFGITMDMIVRSVETKNFGRNFLVAVGKPALKGVDGKVTYLFDPECSVVPKPLAGGEYDYSDITALNLVKKDDIICNVVMDTCGTDGKNIFGHPLLSTDGEPLNLECGQNTKLSDDGKSVLALCDGQVVLKDYTVSIVKIMETGEINATSENILFAGTLLVNGDLKSRSTLRIGGDIIVTGIINSGNIICSGSVVALQGISGNGNTLKIEAHHNVRAKFIEFATINARNSVYANSITSSDIECGSSLMLLGNYGCYVGGFCSLEDDLIAKDIGNETGVVTEVEIHGTPKLEREKAMCENLLETYAEKREAIHNLALERAKSVMGNKKELKIIARLLFLEHRLDKEIVRLTPRVTALTTEIIDSPPGKITVTGCMHQNVTLTLNGTSKRSTKERTAFTAYKYRDLIRYRSLETPTDDGDEPSEK